MFDFDPNNIKIIYNVTMQNREDTIKQIIIQLFELNSLEDFENYTIKNTDKTILDFVGYQRNIKVVADILMNISPSYSVVFEYFHVDKNFRDSYYTFFSNKHFEMERNCIRISLFKSLLCFRDLWDLKTQNKLTDNVIGMIIISPLNIRHIVKALINPFYLNLSDQYYVRLSKYTFHVYGIKCVVEAFPYQTQDNETTRCAEVTLLNILDYYSNTYKEYKNAVPSVIIDLEKKHCHERVLPSQGINYKILCKILYDLEFSPKIYNLQSMNKDFSGITKKDKLRRILYRYIESGIIVAVNVEPKNTNTPGHSLLCIGHTKKIKKENANKKCEHFPVKINKKITEIDIIDSADFYDEFVVIDDNQSPYTIQEFSKMSIYKNMEVSNLAVPLYKRMFLDASDAYNIVMSIIKDKKFGIINNNEDLVNILNGNNKIVTRLFLASSRSYKNFKICDKENEIQSDVYRMFYGTILLPQFIWVCEIYSYDKYLKDHLAFGEIIIDATSSSKNGLQGIISINLPSGIYSRNPGDKIYSSNEILDFIKIYDYTGETNNWREFKGYNRNLFIPQKS